MLIETKDNGGGDGGTDEAEVVSGGGGGGDECPKEMPCIDCGDSCKPEVYKATCTIADKKIKCSDNGMWDYVDGGGGGEDFSPADECPKAMPCIDCGDSCKPKVHKATCTIDDKKIKCSAAGMWDYVDGGGGGEDFSLGTQRECPKERPCPDCEDACDPKVDTGICKYDPDWSLKCNPNGVGNIGAPTWDFV